MQPAPPPSLSPPTLPLPSSSFSTLTGWAGDDDYKFHGQHHPHLLASSSMRSWPETSSTHTSMVASPTSPSPWYTAHHDTGVVWGADPSQGTMQRPQLHHPGLPTTSTDWDRMEYRAGTDMGLAVGPNPVPRTLDFQEELRRMHGGG
ncbi:hypothetical protein NLJ89_g2183 [Agrocybe chaxingu]|uniref:Uncharacterized protein n=1 Tax=Agrocybe chaxingu TaxID=84603 RepID=A0A9W8K7A2_9AGAR|nr:hypothetical protein NLJ89_g2183 [Agrocybe chaxingu]